MGIFEAKFKIGFWNIDSENKITTRSIIQFMQEGAGMHSHLVGYGLDNPNCSWVILNWKLKVFSRPSWGNTITIKTWPRVIEKFYSYRDFEAFDENGKLIAISTSKWILVNPTNLSISKITPEMVDAYGIYDKKVFEEDMEEKINIPEQLDLIYSYTIQKRDIDTNHHVNNLNYIDFAIEALPEEVYINNSISNIEIIYKKQILYKDTIKVYYSFKNNTHIITIKNVQDSIVHAIIKICPDGDVS